jgi:hypothetical protein
VTVARRSVSPSGTSSLSDLSEPGTAPPAPSTKSSAAYRSALAAVIFLGVLIVIAVVVLVVGLVTRFSSGHKAATPAFAQFTLAPGNRLVSMDVAADRLVLRLRGPAGDEIDIIDTESGRLVARIRSAPPPKP